MHIRVWGKKNKIINSARGKEFFRALRSPPPSPVRSAQCLLYPAENVDTNNIRQKLDMPPRKKENGRKDTRYNETKRRHDWVSAWRVEGPAVTDGNEIRNGQIEL